ncbi:hypothetical protein FA13DRAFT_1874268, partial [Coprinellus micaceus]
MEVALQAARNAQGAYLKDVNGHNALLAPIKQMPFDILSLIFQAVAQGSSEPVSPAHPSTVISQVCSDWRRIALESPSIW